MAEIKDKVVRLETLKALHEHNQNTYMTKVDPVGNGTLIMNGDIIAHSITLGNAKLSYSEADDALQILFD